MSPRSLFNIILKILGILLVKDMLIAVPSLFGMFIYMGADRSSGYGSLALVALSILLYGWIAWQLLVRTDQVIDLFKLDKNFSEENLGINMHRSSVLTIAVTVIGGLVLVDAIPEVCRQVIHYWERKRFFPDE